MPRKKIIITGSIILVIGLAVYFLFFNTKKQPIVLTTETATRGSISETVTSTGTVQPVDTVAVGTQISGVIKEMYTDYNANVKKGQLLAILDPTLMQATLDQIKGNLAQANSNLTYQIANFDRQKQLYEVGAISKAAYDNAYNTIGVAKASVNSIKAQITAAQQNLNFTKIYSPIDGVVLSRSVSVGQTVAASFNTPTLFSIAKDISNMQVMAKIDEADIGNIKAGERVTFTVDAFVDDLFEGKVAEVRLRPTTSANVVTYTTIINARNDSLKLKPGMTATITIFTNEAENALLIPVKATKYSPDTTALSKEYKLNVGPTAASLKSNEAYVWVQDGPTISRKKITTGLNDNNHVQVLSGLSATDRIITGMLTGESAVQAGAAKSPFMPTPPKRR